MWKFSLCVNVGVPMCRSCSAIGRHKDMVRYLIKINPLLIFSFAFFVCYSFLDESGNV